MGVGGAHLGDQLARAIGRTIIHDEHVRLRQVAPHRLDDIYNVVSLIVGGYDHDNSHYPPLHTRRRG